MKITRWEEAVTTVLFTGYSPVAPATVASALTCLIFWFFPSALGFWGAIFTIPATFIGVVLSNRYIEGYEVIDPGIFAKFRRPNPEKHDPDPVVFDEFVGQWITLLAVPYMTLPAPLNFVLAFFIFRALDIAKPLGISSIQHAPGGWGVMLDDVAAGFVGFVLLFLTRGLYPF